jgi:hypothetical protein
MEHVIGHSKVTVVLKMNRRGMRRILSKEEIQRGRHLLYRSMNMLGGSFDIPSSW